jgi:hypothetical protein
VEANIMNVTEIIEEEDGGAQVHIELQEDEVNLLIRYALQEMFKDIAATIKQAHAEREVNDSHSED